MRSVGSSRGGRLRRPGHGRCRPRDGLPGPSGPGQPIRCRGDARSNPPRAVAGGEALSASAHQKSREVLPDGLREVGARVDTVAVYRTVAADVDWECLGERLKRGEFEALTFASPSAVRHFFGGIDTAARESTERCILAAIGPVTADALRAEGIEPDVVPESAEIRALVEALAQHVTRRGKGSEGQGGRR